MSGEDFDALPPLPGMVLAGAGSVAPSSADLLTVAFGGPLHPKTVSIAQQEQELRAKLAHMAGTIPSLAPSVDEVLRSADEADGSYKIDRLAEGCENLLRGLEFVDGQWREFGLKGVEDFQAVFAAMTTLAKAGAVAMKEIAERLDRVKAMANYTARASRPPNRRERRTRAALARSGR